MMEHTNEQKSSEPVNEGASETYNPRRTNCDMIENREQLPEHFEYNEYIAKLLADAETEDSGDEGPTAGKRVNKRNQVRPKVYSKRSCHNYPNQTAGTCSPAEYCQPVETRLPGKVMVAIPGVKISEWLPLTRILVDGRNYVGFFKSDGTFKVTEIPSGSYVVEIANPTYVFEPARVDITSKGKMRARKVNNVQSTSVATIPYPLRFKTKLKAGYFQQREEFHVTDMLKNPMVLMMVVPLIFIVIMPKLINTQDPEIQKEMQSMNMLNQKQDLPDLSEMAANFFGGGSMTVKKRERIAGRGRKK